MANTGSVVRFPYRNGDLKATAKPEVVVPDISAGGLLRGGGHWTRDIVFSPDGQSMYVSVGSRSNNDDDPEGQEKHRAMILKYNPDGSGFESFATGMRNAVGLAIHPQTGDVWASSTSATDSVMTSFRITSRMSNPAASTGGPGIYIGSNPDPKHKGKHPDLAAKVIVPDVLIQAHSASLCMTFYPGFKSFGFPAEYQGAAFAVAAWLLEPRPADRLQGGLRTHNERQSDRRVCRFHDRLRDRRRQCVGPTRRRDGRERWLPHRDRRRQ